MIAILSSNIHTTYEWFKRTYPIQSANMAQRRITTMDGKEYVIVLWPEQIRGYQFESYIKSPDYYSLEDAVKAQIHG